MTKRERAAESRLPRKAEDWLTGRRARYTDEVANIVEAAYKVIEATGSTDPSLRAILAEAGVSTPVFYRHFDSKDELLVLLLDDGRRQLAGYLKTRLDKVDDPEGKIRAWVDGMMAQVTAPAAAQRTRPFFVDQGLLDRNYAAQQQESIQRLVDLLHEPVAALSLRPSDSTLKERHAAAIYCLVTGAMRHHLTYQTTPSKAECRHLADFCLAGIRNVGSS
ncbi:TetR/AcrR family transcriptional regulator [Mycobacterium spongiae]|uniref:TetR family transcriptional regulator n=1 Tax=Mycobacterium spongiae TaxID=886343 RepID=A0A975JZ91_9MYCO|nr:TetR/AcrR family transcriptional regulator [Mycobacterium spongiae]QUR67804.1 TetR family transcriptional regulator [Mycobacterium spongiae]